MSLLALLACIDLPGGPPSDDDTGTAVGTDSGTETDADTDADADTDSDTDTDTDTDTPVDPACVDVPVVTWESWGRGFLIENCQGCHASTAPDRYDAPESVVFDTQDDAYRWKDRILSRATGDAPSMPPAGGVSHADRELLTIWLTCWIEQDVAE